MLVSGFRKHLIGDCLFKETRNAAPVRPVLPAPPVMRNPGPVDRGAPLPFQQQAYGQAEKGARVGADGRRSQVYYLTSKEANALECGAQYPEQGP